MAQLAEYNMPYPQLHHNAKTAQHLAQGAIGRSDISLCSMWRKDAKTLLRYT